MVPDLGLHDDLVYRHRGERTCSRSCKPVPLDCATRARIADLGLVRRRRGCRAGRSARDRRRVYLAETETAPWAIPVVSTDRSLRRDVRRRVPHRCPQHRVLLPVRRQSTSPVRVGLFNARSVSSGGKSHSIAAWITDRNLTAAGLTETWHDGADSPSLIACAPPGYVFTERARPRTNEQTAGMSTNHGGVCLLYRDHLHARLVDTATFRSFEHVAVFLHGHGFQSLFIVVYRPGSMSVTTVFFDEFADLLDRVTSYSSVVIMGDVNLHLDMPTDPTTVNFTTLLSANNFVQLVQTPTHTAGHLLDVVVVRSDTEVMRVNVPPPVLSDHSMIDVALDLRRGSAHHETAATYRTCRSWRTFNYDEFERDLRQSVLVRSPPSDINDLVAAYHDTLESLLDLHAPYRRVRQSTRPSEYWYDAECRAAKRRTRCLERVYRRHPSAESRAAWTVQFKAQRLLFRQKATDYWSTAIADSLSDPRRLWQKIDRVIKPPTTIHIPHSADDFASHFVGKVDKIRASTASSADHLVIRSRSPETVLSSFHLVTAEDACRLISRAPCKHCDLDPAPTWLIKRAADVLAPVVASICNASLQSGLFPDSQKRALVRARLKKPSLSPGDLNSYRPISNLTFLSKILERVVVRQFVDHADQNGLLPTRQSAYRKFHSTESAVLVVHNDIVHAIDQGQVVALVLLDLSSAFDTVDHPTLLSLLQDRFAVSDQSLSWFHSYLTNRTQTFTTSSSQTSPLLLTSGVPQGSGLGPTSFLTYTEGTTDIFSQHSLLYHLYADDTQTYGHCSISGIPALISRLAFCISDLSESYSALRLQLNPSKTEFIWFGTRCNLNKIPCEHLSLPVGSSKIPCSAVVRDLGVVLDSELSMKYHIGKVTSTCYYHLRRLHHIRKYVTRETMIQLVMSFVISRIDYCNSVLVGLPTSTLAPLQRVQNAAARLILGLSRRSHITPALKQLHWLPVKFRIIFKIAITIHNILHERSPPYLNNLITFSVGGPQRRQLRSTTARSATVIRTRTQFGRRAFSVCGPDIWNSLPVNIRLIDSHPSFRRALKTHLFNIAFT